MRPLAICISIFAASSCLGGEWTTQSDVKVTASSAALPAVEFDPNLSLEENNRRLAQRDPHEFLLASVELPNAHREIEEWMGRPVQFTVGNKAYSGHVFAYKLDGNGHHSGTIQLFARIRNKRDSGGWHLRDGHVGELRLIGENP